MYAGLLLTPLFGALAAWLIPSEKGRPWVLPAVGALHLALTLDALPPPPPPSPGGWLHLDPLGRLVLLSVSLLFLACSVYAVGYLGFRRERANRLLCDPPAAPGTPLPRLLDAGGPPGTDAPAGAPRGQRKAPLPRLAQGRLR